MPDFSSPKICSKPYESRPRSVTKPSLLPTLKPEDPSNKSVAELLSQLQRREQHVARGVQHLDVVLVGARGRDHVRHFLDHVDVRCIDIPLRIRQRIAGV